MTDRPIIFSAPMVRALLEGRKTMTRRLAWGREYTSSPRASVWQKVQSGDRLWVRETWAVSVKHDGPRAVYAADDADRTRTIGHRWNSPIHMPRWASRLTLTITAMKIEQLQDISEADARSEGCEGGIPEFIALWEALHGEHGFRANPEVVALAFFVAKRNIDSEAS